jgi:Holliday junction resolvasome RuvABC endonuclease subunit
MIPPVIAGIDLGVRKISVFYLQNDEVLGTSHSEMLHIQSRAEELSKLVMLTHEDGYFPHADYYFIEEPLSGRGIRASLHIAQTCGALLYVLGDMGEQEVHLVPVKTWKKHVVGNGNASKDACGDFLKSSYSDYHAACGTNLDLIDAACLAVYGARVVGRSRDLRLTDEAATRDD